MRKIILALLGLLLIIGAVFGAQKIIDNKRKPKQKTTKVVKTVFVDTIRNTTVPIIIKANGNLIAQRRVDLYSEVQGIFRSSNKLFKTGQAYRKGETLIRMDASEYYSSVQAAKSDLYNLITAIMPDLRLDYPDVFNKWQNYLNGFDMEKSVPKLPGTSSDKEKYFITGRKIYATYYNVKNLEQRLAKFVIYAPFTGVLTATLVTEGTLISPGQKLGEFIQTGNYEMEVAIGTAFSDLLQVGASVTLSNLKGTKTYTGTVVRVNGRIDQASQTVTAYIAVKDSDLKEGMYLEAQLSAKQEENAITIDRSLLQQGNQVFVVRDSILDLVKVDPVYFSEKEVVLKGLQDGTLLLAKSVPGAYVGMLVKRFEGKLQATKSTNSSSDASAQ